MRLVPANTNIDFIRARPVAVAVSATLLLISVATIAIQRLALGIDFTGGVVIEVVYPGPVQLKNVREALDRSPYHGATVQFFGTSSDVMIRLVPKQGAKTSDVSNVVLAALRKSNANVKIRRVEFVGPQVGKELANKGGLALLFALIGILIYVIFRFHWKLSVGAVLALVHDVGITVGFFSLFQVQFDLTVIAALLAVLGYSINDTIVVYDRIRENFRRMRKATSFEVVNASINQTLARTLMTSGTTLLTVSALFIFGGPVIHGFALALLVGIVVGTYSSIYIASSLALWLDVDKLDLFPPREETAERHL